MLKRIDGLPAGAIGFAASGRISIDESRRLVAPAVDDALRTGKVRLLYEIRPDFSGYEVGMLDEAVFGTRHFTHFDKIAFVGGSPHDRPVRLLAGLMPAGIEVFPPDAIESAKAWLAR